MRRGLQIGVAVHAGEHAAMDGVLEGLGVDVEAGGLAVNFVRKSGVGVAGETIVRGGLWWLFGSGDAAGEKHRQH